MITIFSGTLASIGLGITNSFRYNFILKDCNVSSGPYSLFETGMFIAINILKAVSFLVFVWCMPINASETSGERSNVRYQVDCEKSWSYLGRYFMLMIMFIITFLAPIIGIYRDHVYIHDCGTVTTKTLAIIGCHFSVKFVVLLATVALCFSVIIVISTSANKWNAYKLQIKDWKLKKTGAVKKFLDTKSYSLYNDYIEVGNNTDTEREIIKRWFVIQYFVYLFSVLVRIVHIIKPLFSANLSSSGWEVSHSFLYLVFDLFGFLLPYYMGTLLNKLHEAYYKKMKDVYFEMKVQIPFEDHSITFVCQPGNKKPKQLHVDDTRRTRNQKEEKMAKDLYLKYYSLAMEKNMNKIKEFDLVPSMMGISVPLDSQGYTFTILLTIMSIIFNLFEASSS